MDPATRPSSTRRVLILLVVLAGALLALSIVQRDRALENEYEDAQVRAELYAATVFRSTLGPLDVATPLEGTRRDSLFAEVQAFVLIDPTNARVRLWSPDGTLLFSTDPADNPGETSQQYPSIATAAGGAVQSRLAVEPVSLPSTAEADRRATPLFQTFAPLRVRGSANVVGAVEVEQFAAALEKRADDPWWLFQAGASGATVLLALLALIAVARGMRRPAPRRERTENDRPSRKKREEAGWDEGGSDLRDRLEGATARAKEAEAAAQSFAASLQQVSNRLEAGEGQSSDERVAELKESLRRSEAERAMLRAGRPETLVEAEVRELRGKLRDSQALAKAAEALVAGGGDLSAVQEQLSTAARQVDAAVERAKIAEGRADAAEDRARATGDLATAAEQRIDMLEIKLQEIVAGVGAADGPELVEVQRQLDEARQRADEMGRRASDAESRLAVAGSLDGPAEELLQNLEERVVAAEARAVEAESRLRSFEEEAVEGGSRFRQRLGLTAAGRKLAAPTPVERETLPDMDLRSAIARGLRGPLTRASGLTLSLQGTIDSGDGKAALRQLSSSLRRVDQLAADLHHVHRIMDGSLPLNLRRTDLAALTADILDDPVTLEERLIRLDADTVHARVDPARARQIVEGMLDAARERTRAGAAIVVRVRETDAGARVSVEDDNRLPATIGAEMSLAVRLAELHGTEITVDGSSYRVVFPKDEGP
ncbi:hypothetical protein BH18ACT14_BH18ACT14_13820 [soil metagenome]